jgi:hypothetical protein
MRTSNLSSIPVSKCATAIESNSGSAPNKAVSLEKAATRSGGKASASLSSARSFASSPDDPGGVCGVDSTARA